MPGSGEAECKQTGDFHNSDKIVIMWRSRDLAQSSADFALIHRAPKLATPLQIS